MEVEFIIPEALIYQIDFLNVDNDGKFFKQFLWIMKQIFNVNKNW